MVDVLIVGCEAVEISNFSDALAFIQRLFIENANLHDSCVLVQFMRYEVMICAGSVVNGFLGDGLWLPWQRTLHVLFISRSGRHTVI